MKIMDMIYLILTGRVNLFRISLNSLLLLTALSTAAFGQQIKKEESPSTRQEQPSNGSTRVTSSEDLDNDGF